MAFPAPALPAPLLLAQSIPWTSLHPRATSLTLSGSRWECAATGAGLGSGHPSLWCQLLEPCWGCRPAAGVVGVWWVFKPALQQERSLTYLCLSQLSSPGQPLADTACVTGCASVLLAWLRLSGVHALLLVKSAKGNAAVTSSAWAEIPGSRVWCGLWPSRSSPEAEQLEEVAMLIALYRPSQSLPTALGQRNMKQVRNCVFVTLRN